MSMWGGIATSRAASDLSRHDLPQPFGPRRPYRLHGTSAGRQRRRPLPSAGAGTSTAEAGRALGGQGVKGTRNWGAEQ